eukprot:CAMPEP_0178390930 /NCGR_PEP_ID=MMETSP0689_2-20121128/10899_1 /TAXON_ID=160604 /ORGANISM="Amphidinium massartii, Strain CS-259" /LENGTH=429 /DNA_ID=CAMNT_0020011453 /DNA_START=75 /DNA_END=1361 /DNA_ORIENTATION=-
MCSDGLQVILEEHRREISGIWTEHDSLRNELRRVTEELSAWKTAWSVEKQTLQEEISTLREALNDHGLLSHGQFHQFLGKRRAPEVLRDMLQMRELSSSIAAFAGITALRHASMVSCDHGLPLNGALQVLLRGAAKDIFVIGGKNDIAPALDTIERYSPSQQRWSTSVPLPRPRYGCAAAAVDGSLYVMGGDDGTRVLANVDRFDPQSGQWDRRPRMPTPRSRCAAAVIKGMVYVIGGRESLSTYSHLTATERYEVLQGRWDALPPLHVAPLGCAAAALEGKVYLVGHVSNADRRMEVKCLDVQSRRWESLPPCRQRFGCAVAAVSGCLWVVGGHDGEQIVPFVDRFDPRRGRWESMPALPTPRHGCAAVGVAGKLYVLGGDAGPGDDTEEDEANQLTATERYNPATARWESLPNLTTGRFGCAAVAVW